MVLRPKTLERLRILINEETEYRSGPQLVSFFNHLGFHDTYGPGFPSRKAYTDEKLNRINGTPELDKCINAVFDPANFIGRINELDSHIKEFNQYLAFDKWRVIRSGAEIEFKKLDKIEIDDSTDNDRDDSEDNFLRREFQDVSVTKIGLEGVVTTVIEARIDEIGRCFSAGAFLSVIVMVGSTLEGILLGLANKYPKRFNGAIAAPKDKYGNVRKFYDWNLGSFIDVAYELNLVQRDTQKFSHTVRDFRNYIHPFEQMSARFTPREQTAKISLQVLKAAIYEITENIASL